MTKTKSKKPEVSEEQNTPNHRSTSIGGDVTDSVVISGDGNQTTFQKIINIFKGESESTDHRNRRVMLNHVENFWIKGVLEKSLHGVALLELGMKEDPTAVHYPWGIKKASTNETLPAGESMSQIFNEIGLGRSLLVLGAPGSGKTTMLLELTRQLIEVARKNETEPIPVVFNLSSWTEKLSLTDWIAEQLNIFYYVPKKTAQKLVTENKMFLLLDGLDEVKEDLREKCVNAINEFKNEHGLTSLAICSRIEEYQTLQTKLSLAGAITLQPLTSEQVDSYFDKFGKSLLSLKQILKKDKTLGELTETPLMLSIMVLAYKDVNIKEIPELKNVKEQRKHLFDTYINRMFERRTRSEKKDFYKEETLHYLSWLGRQMVQHNLSMYQIEEMQPFWLENKSQQHLYKWIAIRLMNGLMLGMIFGLILGLMLEMVWGLIFGLIFGLSVELFFGLIFGVSNKKIKKIMMVNQLQWSHSEFFKDLKEKSIFGLILGLIGGLIGGVIGLLTGRLDVGLVSGLAVGIILGLIAILESGLVKREIEETNYPEQRIKKTFYISIYRSLFFGVIWGLIFFASSGQMIDGLIGGLSFGLLSSFGSLIRHYVLRNIVIKNGFIPRNLVPFLEYCVDLIFLRRVGGSYIFVHRLLMEHFAEMYIEKENT